MSCRIRQKNASHLFTVYQKKTKSLKDYVKQFNHVILKVEDPSDKVVIMVMMEGLRLGPLFDSLSKNVLETLSALQNKVDKYIASEELTKAKRRRRGRDDPKRKEPDSKRPKYRDEARSKRANRDSRQTNEKRPRTPPRHPELILPPLNAPIAQVLTKIKHEEFVKWPRKIKTDPRQRNRNKYCEFHRDHGHNTKDCFQLKEQIASLIKKEYLRKHVTNCPPPNSPKRRYSDNRSTAGNIQVIHGGFGSGEYTSSIRNITHPLGWIKLLVTLGMEPHYITIWQDFIVVDCPSPYNTILGRPTLGGTKAITSTYHLKMKFPTSTGVGEVRGDQKVARQCFISAMKNETSTTPIAQ
ncbi:hypothetical protein Acr_00g0089910 [Actinidia rufa]|uniref:Retrotransposon gag domain-containing protein n=1 Tax=Actinidia rufa TaxID=165716 RepID=A0A7J0DXZ6_9ERIC|nr:hypothetical protein Acr_00g0089910 [Actinidia rufa]